MDEKYDQREKEVIHKFSSYSKQPFRRAHGNILSILRDVFYGHLR